MKKFLRHECYCDLRFPIFPDCFDSSEISEFEFACAHADYYMVVAIGDNNSNAIKKLQIPDIDDGGQVWTKRSIFRYRMELFQNHPDYELLRELLRSAFS